METKRLFRSESDKMLGGVCGGLAEYFAIDSSIIRIIFVVMCFGAGWGFMFYVVLWLILPAKSSLGIIGEETIKENTQDMEKVARKVVKSVEEKIANTRTTTPNTKTNTPRRKARTTKRTTKKVTKTA